MFHFYFNLDPDDSPTPPTQFLTHEADETDFTIPSSSTRGSCTFSILWLPLKKATGSWAGDNAGARKPRESCESRGQNTHSDVWSELGLPTQKPQVKISRFFELMDMGMIMPVRITLRYAALWAPSPRIDVATFTASLDGGVGIEPVAFRAWARPNSVSLLYASTLPPSPCSCFNDRPLDE